MAVVFPFLTAADPLGTSEGSLDPLGLYQIADLLGTELVPAVRQRMLRVRFLSAMAVGAFVTEGLEADPRYREAAPYLVWEWHVVEAIVRTHDRAAEDRSTWGVPGIGVTRRAVKHYDRLDARTYLATPRVFGFNGVYKRLAIQLGITDVHLAPGPMADRLVKAWAGSMDSPADTLIARWRAAVERALGQSPPMTRPGWNRETWAELAHAFLPNAKDSACSEERKLLRELLTTRSDGRLGALPEIWDLQTEFPDDDLPERRLHERLEQVDPSRGPLLAAIRAYESFARSLQDAFDMLRFLAGAADTNGFDVPATGLKPEFRRIVHGLDSLYMRASERLAALPPKPIALEAVFTKRFGRFAETLGAGDAAWAIVEHHRQVQRDKSATGKLPWLDDLGRKRIHVRQAYRLDSFDPQPDVFLHAYRGLPIRRFRSDLGGR
jgi:hypothetical protein